MADKNSRAVVLLSGGQDSTTALYWAKEEFEEVRALTIDYGQQHAIEVQAAEKIAKMAQVEYEVIEIPDVLVSTSPLLSGAELGQYESVDKLPTGIEPTFIPCRNALFLTVAANRAILYEAPNVVIAVSQEDYGGYPDCRHDFLQSMNRALFHATRFSFDIRSPLLNLTKRATVDLAQKLPGCMEALAWSHTCYAGKVPPCGKCHACLLRARGFEQAKVVDPLLERVISAS